MKKYINSLRLLLLSCLLMVSQQTNAGELILKDGVFVISDQAPSVIPVVPENTSGETWKIINGQIYGAKPDSRGAIGGGTGYFDIITSGDYTVTTYAELKTACATARSGEVIFIPSTATINFDGQSAITLLNDGVTIASDRGNNGSTGALLKRDIKVNGAYFFLVETNVNNIRFTGLNIQNAKTDTTYEVAGKGKIINTYGGNTEIDNCELSGAGVAAINIGNSAPTPNIHHNYIHNNQLDGLGYGVLINRNSHATIEYNIFAANRHGISGNGDIGCSYTARHNIFPGYTTNGQIDMHGYGGDGTPAGADITIENNFFPDKGKQVYAVNIRGVPSGGPAKIHRNIFGAWNDDDPCIQTYFSDRALTVDVSDNIYSDGKVQ